jgi:hypothetical protein
MLVNGILPFATNVSDLLSYDAQYGIAALNTAGFRGYDASTVPITGSATQNLRLASGSFSFPDVGGVGTAGTYAANAMSFVPSVAGQALSFADISDTLNLTAGALVSSPNLARAIGGTVGNGRITDVPVPVSSLTDNMETMVHRVYGEDMADVPRTKNLILALTLEACNQVNNYCLERLAGASNCSHAK